MACSTSALPSSCKGLRPAVFLDRDGVLNEDTNYVSLPHEIRWIPGAHRAVSTLNKAGYYVFVVTNQAGIARGFYSAERVHALHDWMQHELRQSQAHIDAFFYCPHHPDFSKRCACRKPEPGMILQAFSEWPVLREGSFLIGDKESDLSAAANAGIEGYLFLGDLPLDMFLKKIISLRASAGFADPADLRSQS